MEWKQSYLNYHMGLLRNFIQNQNREAKFYVFRYKLRGIFFNGSKGFWWVIVIKRFERTVSLY